MWDKELKRIENYRPSPPLPFLVWGHSVSFLTQQRFEVSCLQLKISCTTQISFMICIRSQDRGFSAFSPDFLGVNRQVLEFIWVKFFCTFTIHLNFHRCGGSLFSSICALNHQGFQGRMLSPLMGSQNLPYFFAHINIMAFKKCHENVTILYTDAIMSSRFSVFSAFIFFLK